MIYCVEDDDDIRELMLYTLKTAGFEAQGFPDGDDFWQAISIQQPDLILLDIMLPGSDGLAILEKLLRQTFIRWAWCFSTWRRPPTTGTSGRWQKYA